jgi:hypothetical protein
MVCHLPLNEGQVWHFVVCMDWLQARQQFMCRVARAALGGDDDGSGGGGGCHGSIVTPN